MIPRFRFTPILSHSYLESAMPIDFEDVSDDFRRITISGRLDIVGTDEIAAKFAALAASAKRRVVVDLRQVTFLASIGIRSLISNAKALHQRGGRMVICVGENVAVAKTLEMTGIAALIPLVVSADDADKAAMAA